jgi:hypothetical protein
VDVNDLSLVGAQSELIRAIVATGVPTIVVLSSGKPISEPWLSNSTSALFNNFTLLKKAVTLLQMSFLETTTPPADYRFPSPTTSAISPSTMII